MAGSLDNYVNRILCIKIVFLLKNIQYRLIIAHRCMRMRIGRVAIVTSCQPFGL